MRNGAGVGPVLVFGLTPRPVDRYESTSLNYPLVRLMQILYKGTLFLYCLPQARHSAMVFLRKVVSLI